MWAGLILAGGAVWLGVYVWDQGFTGKWRGLIAKELAKHGLRAEIGRLTLDPVDGLTARDVKLYDIAQRGQHLADIDRISLDIDVARLMNQEDFLRTIHLQRADVSLPVDPSDAHSEWLTVKDLNARLVFQKDEIEIARAEGVVSGILVKASGTVRKPGPLPGSREQKERLKEERTRQLREMRDRRGLLRSLLRGLDRFSIPLRHGLPERANKAEITLELQGDLSDIDRMEIRALLSGGPLLHRGGRVEGIEASARLSEGLLTLQRLELKDGQGALHAAASWKIRQAPAVDFAVDCTMDLQSMLRSALDDAPWLGEVVCYTPPEWSWNGRFFTNAGAGAFPVEGQGYLKAGRFSTRGMVFDGLEGKVGLKADGQIYVRNGLLLHHSGEVRGQILWGPEQSRYEADWRMAFNPVKPFLPDGEVQSFMERFTFDQASRIAVSLQGDRAAAASPWRHAGRFELRDFSYQGTALREVGGSVAFNPDAEVPLVFRDAVLEMTDGLGKAREVQLDLPKGLLTLVGGEGTVMPAPLLHLFYPPLGRALEKYRFGRPPETRMEGVVDLKNQGRSDYRIALRTRSRCGLDVAGRPMEFDGTAGTLHVLGPEIALQLTGSTAPGTESFNVLRFEDPAPASFAGTFSLDPAKPQASWKVDVRAPGRVSLKVLDRTWPLEQFAGGLETAGAGFTGAGGARLLDGKFGVSLDFPDAGSVAHQGSIVVRNVSFAQLSAIVDPARKTAGRLTGSFSYNIPNLEPGSLTGNGEATLEDADIFALPLLGPLSPLVDAIIPGDDIISSTARTATSTLTVTDGRVTLPNFTASTDAFKLTVSGFADYLKNRVDFLGRVNLRGAPGVLLYPVSKLFEYAADGTLSDPAWHPRFFAGPFRNKPAAQETPVGTDAPSLLKAPETVNPPRLFRPRRSK
jgi:hypothetical protein